MKLFIFAAVFFAFYAERGDSFGYELTTRYCDRQIEEGVLMMGQKTKRSYSYPQPRQYFDMSL